MLTPPRTRQRIDDAAPQPVDLHVGRRIRLRRQLVGLTQQRLADAIGITFQQIQKYERGANRVSASRLYDLARALAVDVPFFFQGMAEDAPADAEDLEKTETLELIRLYWAFNREQRRAVLEVIKSMAGPGGPDPSAG